MAKRNYSPARVTGENGAADESLSSMLRRAAEQELARAHVPGAQVVLRRNGELLWSACAGHLRLTASSDTELAGESPRVERSDRFVIASVTKLVISCVTMSLVERGELDLDQTVSRWLPQLPNSESITIRMLLSHSSGLSEYFKDKWVRQQLEDNPLRHWSRGDIIRAIARLGPESEPGSRFAYRNSNYLIVGEILELSTGKRIGQLVEEHVSRPLDLGTLSFAKELPGGGNLASPYLRRLGHPANPLKRTGERLPSDAVGEVWTDGGIAASAEDLATLTEALFRDQLLRHETVKEMSTPLDHEKSSILRVPRVLLPQTVDSAYGLGVTIERQGGSVLLGHNGMYLGWSAITTFDTRSRLTVTVLTNLADLSVPAQQLEKKLRTTLA